MTTAAAPPPPTKTWEGVLLDGVIAYYSSNTPALLALAESLNQKGEALATAGLQALLSKEPLLSVVLGGEVSALSAQLDPFLVKEEGYAAQWILNTLKAFAAKYGG